MKDFAGRERSWGELVRLRWKELSRKPSWFDRMIHLGRTVVPSSLAARLRQELDRRSGWREFLVFAGIYVVEVTSLVGRIPFRSRCVDRRRKTWIVAKPRVQLLVELLLPLSTSTNDFFSSRDLRALDVLGRFSDSQARAVVIGRKL
jgi:hypothetical protein